MPSDSKVIATAIIGPKHQTTIPKTVREALQVGPGDELAWIPLDDQVWLLPRNRTAERSAGMLSAFIEESAMNDDEAIAVGASSDDEAGVSAAAVQAAE